MTYYFISLDSGRLEKLQKRIDFLSGGIWIEDKKGLSEVLANPAGEAIFFLHLDEQKEINEWAAKIRKDRAIFKLIFVMNSMAPQELKEHQMSTAGGDAYVHESIDEDMLADIVRSLVEEAPVAQEITAEIMPELHKLGHSLEVVPELKLVKEESLPPEPKMEEIFSDISKLNKVLEHPLSKSMDVLFTEVLQLSKSKGSLEIPDLHAPPVPPHNQTSGDNMSDKDQELSLDDLGELEIGSLEGDSALLLEEGMDFSLDSGAEGEVEFELGGDGPSSSGDGSMSNDLDLGEEMVIQMASEPEEVGAEEIEESDEDEMGLGDISLGEDENKEEISLVLEDSDEEIIENIGELDLSLDDALPPLEDVALDLDSEDNGRLDFSIGEDSPLEIVGDMSDDAKKKLEEIDALMDEVPGGIELSEASEKDDGLNISMADDDLGELNFSSTSESLEESLVSDDLNLDSISFASEGEEDTAVEGLAEAKEEVLEDDDEERLRKKKKESVAAIASERDLGADFKEISGVYSGEMERTQATIANLREDRQELLAQIQLFEDEKVGHNRQMLTIRAELDEKKIELSIIRKKLNEEISELKDRLKMQEERKLILEEKNRILLQELDSSGQKNKIDMKKVQMRERELEQKLELLKTDAENQIKNRDLKILELKRKVDAMEFDMESISQQEKRSVESRFELEDKLDKAIKTLRTAISVLEDESDRGSALKVLKKNIDV